ncbi:MAG: DUF4058 family protein [Kovacikia sp.]
MHNPFPGMNPYLEHPELWPQVHNRLIVAIADELAGAIAPKYRVAIEQRIYMSIEDPQSLIGIADIGVKRDREEISSPMSPTSTIVKPQQVRLPMPWEVRERYLEIREVATRELVTVIEVLSPANKRSSKGRSIYEAKRMRILSSMTHLVEIDLLRSGKPMPMMVGTSSDYRILVSRSHLRPNADLFAFNLPDPIPVFPIPLHTGDPEPIVDLQWLLNNIYDRARLDLSIDYRVEAINRGITMAETINRDWLESIITTLPQP